MIDRSGARRLGAAVALALALGLPWRGHSDVAAPEGRLTIEEGEACPDAEELTLADLQVEAYGCDVTGIEALAYEEATTCWYALEYTCGSGGSGEPRGCGG